MSKLRGVTSAKSKISVGGVASQLGSSGVAVYTERSRFLDNALKMLQPYTRYCKTLCFGAALKRYNA